MAFTLGKLTSYLLKILFFYLVFINNALLPTSAFHYDLVTVGSSFKLLNKATGARLHSHEVKYGSGSGQQSVTGMKKKEDGNSYWQVRSPTDEVLVRGTPIKCGQKIRLTHLNTQSNLHSHHFGAPLSNGFEVSCFGEDGEGDHLDNWVVECSGDYWRRDQFVYFKHDETNLHLSCTNQVFGRPIPGQHEIVTLDGSGNNEKWKTVEGVFMKPSDDDV